MNVRANQGLMQALYSWGKVSLHRTKHKSERKICINEKITDLPHSPTTTQQATLCAPFLSCAFSKKPIFCLSWLLIVVIQLKTHSSSPSSSPSPTIPPSRRSHDLLLFSPFDSPKSVVPFVVELDAQPESAVPMETQISHLCYAAGAKHPPWWAH